MRPRIAFMTTVGRNVGDEFIREGIRSFFDEACPEGYEPYYVNKHDLSTLNGRVYDEAHSLDDKFRDADVIVQAGAPVYWNLGKHKSYNGYWAQALWFDRIFQLGPSKMILNLGAGAGQSSENDLAGLMEDPKIVEFAREAGRACAWTTVRDPLASRFLATCGVEHELMPCPAFHAARRQPSSREPNDLLAVNFMPNAGHYQLKPQTDPVKWRDVIEGMLPAIRKRHKLLFVAHDKSEAEFQSQFLRDGESVFCAADYRDFIALYGRVKGIVANRVHASICVAGFGRPAVIIGNDARIGIARPIGIPAIDSSEVSVDWILAALDQQFQDPGELRTQRLSLRETSASQYVSRLRAIMAQRFDLTRRAAA